MIIPSFSYGIIAASYPRAIAQVSSPVQPGLAIFGTTASSGSFPPNNTSMQFSVYGSGNQLHYTYWDGTTGAFYTLGSHYIPSKQIVSPYNDTTEKRITAYVINTTGQTGSIYTILVDGVTFSYFDARGCTQCYSVSMYFNGAINGCPPTLDKFPESQYLDVIVTPPHSLTSVTLPSTATEMRFISLLGCINLQSLRMPGIGSNFYGFMFGGIYSKIFSGLDLRNCGLNAAALNQVYTDLATANPAKGSAYIRVFGNPGTSTDSPSIATAKGYVVYGSSSEGSTAP